MLQFMATSSDTLQSWNVFEVSVSEKEKVTQLALSTRNIFGVKNLPLLILLNLLLSSDLILISIYFLPVQNVFNHFLELLLFLNLKLQS